MMNIDGPANLDYWQLKDQEYEQEMAEKFTEIADCCKELHEEYSTNKEERFYTLLKLTNLINEYDNIENERYAEI